MNHGSDYWLTDSEVEDVKSIIQSGEIVQGKEVENFEREFASYIGSKHAIACNSGTSALHIALIAAGIVPGQEVITTPLSFIATSNAVIYSGGKPIFADIDKTLNIASHSIEKKISNKTAAILGVHLYGYPFDIEHILQYCSDKIMLIEDTAQALGATFKGKKTGTFGKVGIFSFYDTKHLKLGEGGMIVTDDKDIAERCIMIRSHGARKQYVHEVLGYNYRLNEVFAKIGRIQLKKINSLIDAKRKRARLIYEQLNLLEGISIVKETIDTSSVYYRFPIILDSARIRDKLIELVRKHSSFQLTTGYPSLIYEQSFYREIETRFPMSKLLGLSNYKGSLCPIAESIPPRMIEMPTDPWLQEELLMNLIHVFKGQLKNLR